MTRIDRNMQVGEALFILGHHDLSDVDTLMRDISAKAEKYELVKTWIVEIPRPPSLYLEAKPYWKKVYEEFVDAYNSSQENINEILEGKA